MAYYGIDLGTSTCLAARLEEGFDEGDYSLRCLRDNDDEESFPSVVSFLDNEQFLVGEKAIERLQTAPDSTVELVKIRLGKTDRIPVLIEGKTCEKTPQEITALLLKHLKNYPGQRIVDPVLTVPAIFDQSQKDATVQAGELAQIKITQLIEEPTAAIMYQVFDDYQKYGLDFFCGESEKNVLVFDFGGGTLDLSLIHLSLEEGAVKPSVLAVFGDSELGGNNIDFLFTRLILNRLVEVYPNDPFILEANEAFEDYYKGYKESNKLCFSDTVPTEVRSYVMRLKRELERVKISLSAKDNESIFLGRNYKPIPITRAAFERHILVESEIYDRIREAIQQIIARAPGTPVHEVLLVGGSSQIPYVHKLLLDSLQDVHMSEEAIKTSSDYKHAVAMGAAIQAALISGISVPPFRKNKCTSVLSRDIILHCGNQSYTIAQCGTPYPFVEERKQSFHISHALSESVPIRLTEKLEGQGQEKEICNYRYYLPLYYTDDEMIFSLNIDSAGLYQVTAKHVPTKEIVEFEASKMYSLSKDDYTAAATRVASLTDTTETKRSVFK